MIRHGSLRLRLFILILTPLVLLAILLGYWRYTVAKQTAQELFDDSLLSAGLAISRDVAVSEGDALSPTTRGLIRDASGGEIFYHVTGPGGIYVTGYAYPPASVTPSGKDVYQPQFFEAVYRDEPVRVLKMTERVTLGNLVGDATVTAWQRIADRNAFANELSIRAAILMGILLATLAFVVWFGVARGLRPLLDIQDAIDLRSPDDLSKIKRPVPVEVHGIVRTLNRLFGQVEHSINAHQVFISEAAHQLRNPAAAVQSMAEALRDAKTDEDRDKRIAELVSAAKNSATVAEQLLSLERLRQPTHHDQMEKIDFRLVVEEACAEMGVRILAKGIDFEVTMPDSTIMVSGDQVFLTEAIKNLLDNAVKHGGAELSRISVALCCDGEHVNLTVADDGTGLSPEQSEAAFSRFSQLEYSDGSGLGLSIVSAVAERHRGTVAINKVEKGASITLELPLVL
ncbi:sensor histidine kinase [Ruegeria meonggei]|uniref:histidine kinase n=1 Tax=Ruegeria meonggei TaxID=1446476 RepID=A0A1X6ZMN3_9RHOB|nr:sensor histidine kinase [Ruegeria meonggei]SLN55871.1 Sensor protein QseC [Ruegeria meonggei]